MDTPKGKGGSAILLMLPEDFSSQIIDWGQKNVDSSKLSGLPNKGYEHSPHITLVSNIIDEDPERALRENDFRGEGLIPFEPCLLRLVSQS